MCIDILLYELFVNHLVRYLLLQEIDHLSLSVRCCIRKKAFISEETGAENDCIEKVFRVIFQKLCVKTGISNEFQLQNFKKKSSLKGKSRAKKVC